MEHLEIDSGITFLRVADLERSHRFYSADLGLTLVLDQGGCRIYRLTESAFLGVCERPGPVGSNVIVTFVTEDVDGWHERVAAAGVEPDGPPRDNPDYRIYHFFVTDPDGHTLEVQRFWDDDWNNDL
jgi:catechol 2,3-dioxygenase-like lactoylglutathione lyase family enzyme